MDKSRHPQVIRPWKTSRPTQKNKWSSPPTISHGESVIGALHQEARLTADGAFVEGQRKPHMGTSMSAPFWDPCQEFPFAV